MPERSGGPVDPSERLRRADEKNTRELRRARGMDPLRLRRAAQDDESATEGAGSTKGMTVMQNENGVWVFTLSGEKHSSHKTACCSGT